MSRFSLDNGKFEEILVRTTLPVRDVALSPDGNWIAVASEYVCDSIRPIWSLTDAASSS